MDANKTLDSSKLGVQGSFFYTGKETLNVVPTDIFLQDVKKNLEKNIPSVFNNIVCNEKIKVLLAVSGGVDSQVMLHAIYTLSQEYNIDIHVVSVNHNIRDKDESKRDTLLVSDYCKNILKVPCEIKTVAPGYIRSLSKERGRGIEDAARFARYNIIRDLARDYNAQYVFFAHNRDDQLETLVQHFLQGCSAGISGTASAGILPVIEFPLIDETYVEQVLTLCRPLLTISRSRIEEYAESFSIPFCFDSSNNECAYYRNKIRHMLIPVLKEHFKGWDTAVLNGAEKALEEHSFIEECVKKVSWQVEPEVKMKLQDFLALGFPVRVRLLYKGFSLAGIKARIPYTLVKRSAQGQKRVECSTVEVFHKNEYIIIKKKLASNKEDDIDLFEDISIDACGEYTTSIGTFNIQEQVQKSFKITDTESGEYYIGKFHLPLVIRSKKSGDKILTADNKHKSIKKIFSQWRVDIEHRQIIPLFEQHGELTCIFAELFGYPNWYVKQNITDNKKTVFIRFKRNNNE